jgi:CheY-like chemotaxis protein
MPIKTILIIDDSPTERHILTQLLLSGGYEVSTAESGDEGIERAKQIKPDLILMDVVMPGTNGFQATRALSRDEATKASRHHLHHQEIRKPTSSGACARAPRTTSPSRWMVQPCWPRSPHSG